MAFCLLLHCMCCVKRTHTSLVVLTDSNGSPTDGPRAKRTFADAWCGSLIGAECVHDDRQSASRPTTHGSRIALCEVSFPWSSGSYLLGRKILYHLRHVRDTLRSVRNMQTNHFWRLHAHIWYLSDGDSICHSPVTNAAIVSIR